MLTDNPFAELSASVSPTVMKTYVVIMILLVVGGTLFDVIHKKSAQYFFANWKKSKDRGTRKVGAGQVVSLAIQTAAVEVLASGEFCNPKRRIAHLLTMYGFILYVVTTAIMVFGYPILDASTSGLIPFLWHLGALMVCVGGYWFWFFIRADVVAEGQSPLRLMRADLFIVSLLASVTLALTWSAVQAAGGSWSSAVFGLWAIATAVLFGSVPWSKFAHMFFKPAAALQRRVAEADGSMENLPPPADGPATFGLGIKREEPRHY